jgi:hypothetical protein
LTEYDFCFKIKYILALEQRVVNENFVSTAGKWTLREMRLFGSADGQGTEGFVDDFLQLADQGIDGQTNHFDAININNRSGTEISCFDRWADLHLTRIFHKRLVLGGPFAPPRRSRSKMSSPYFQIRFRAFLTCGLVAGQDFSPKTVCNQAWASFIS